MAEKKQNHPLPPCPSTPNCVRTSRDYETGIEEVFERITNIFDEEALSFKIIDPKRIEVHAVYRIPIFGFKDDVDVIMEEAEGVTTVFIRSASRVGAYDLGVNRRRVKRILGKLTSMISD